MRDFLQKFWKYIAGAVIGTGVVVGAVIPTSTALFETSLANSIGTTDTSMTLVSGTTKDGTTLSGTYAFIIDEGTASEEFVSGSCTNTACTSLTRGLSVVTGTSTVTALKKKHRVGASVKITDAPQLLILSRILNGDESIPNVLHYNAAPSFTYGQNELVTWEKSKDYTDAVALAGAPDATAAVKGVVELATLNEVASSTVFGGTGAYLAIPAYMATDTPTSGCNLLFSSTAGAGCSVVATLAGKIKQTFLDIFSTVNTWTGPNTFSATTTLAGSSLTNNALVINGTAYQFPASNATGTLKNSGNGTLSWGNPIKLSWTGAGPSASNNWATTTTLTIPPGIMTASSTISLRISATGNAVNAGQEGPTLYIRTSGSANVASINCGPLNGTPGTVYCYGDILVSFISASSQTYVVTELGSNNGLLKNVSAVGTSAVDFSQGATLLLVADAVAASKTLNVQAASLVVNP